MSKRGEALNNREFERDEVPLVKSTSPKKFPLLRGRGIKGDGVPYNKL